MHSSGKTVLMHGIGTGLLLLWMTGVYYHMTRPELQKYQDYWSSGWGEEPARPYNELVDKVRVRFTNVTHSLDDLDLFFQISDIHVNAYSGGGKTHLLRFLDDIMSSLEPRFILVTGDLTDAKDPYSLQTRQNEAEWTFYRRAVHSRLGEKDARKRWLDLPGNHDRFDVLGTKTMATQLPSKDSLDALFVVPQARSLDPTALDYDALQHEQESQHQNAIDALFVARHDYYKTHGIQKDVGWLKHFDSPNGDIAVLSMDACSYPGLSQPFNFYGHINELQLARLQKQLAGLSNPVSRRILVCHYPINTLLFSTSTSAVDDQGKPGLPFSRMATGIGLFLCGHLHKLAWGLGEELYAIRASAMSPNSTISNPSMEARPNSSPSSSTDAKNSKELKDTLNSKDAMDSGAKKPPKLSSKAKVHAAPYFRELELGDIKEHAMFRLGVFGPHPHAFSFTDFSLNLAVSGLAALAQGALPRHGDVVQPYAHVLNPRDSRFDLTAQYCLLEHVQGGTRQAELLINNQIEILLFGYAKVCKQLFIYIDDRLVLKQLLPVQKAGPAFPFLSLPFDFEGLAKSVPIGHIFDFRMELKTGLGKLLFIHRHPFRLDGKISSLKGPGPTIMQVPFSRVFVTLFFIAFVLIFIIAIILPRLFRPPTDSSSLKQDPLNEPQPQSPHCLPSEDHFASSQGTSSQSQDNQEAQLTKIKEEPQSNESNEAQLIEPSESQLSLLNETTSKEPVEAQAYEPNEEQPPNGVSIAIALHQLGRLRVFFLPWLLYLLYLPIGPLFSGFLISFDSNHFFQFYTIGVHVTRLSGAAEAPLPSSSSASSSPPLMPSPPFNEWLPLIDTWNYMSFHLISFCLPLLLLLWGRVFFLLKGQCSCVSDSELLAPSLEAPPRSPLTASESPVEHASPSQQSPEDSTEPLHVVSKVDLPDQPSWARPASLSIVASCFSRCLKYVLVATIATWWLIHFLLLALMGVSYGILPFLLSPGLLWFYLYNLVLYYYLLPKLFPMPARI